MATKMISSGRTKTSSTVPEPDSGSFCLTGAKMGAFMLAVLSTLITLPFSATVDDVSCPLLPGESVHVSTAISLAARCEEKIWIRADVVALPNQLRSAWPLLQPN